VFQHCNSHPLLRTGHYFQSVGLKIVSWSDPLKDTFHSYNRAEVAKTRLQLQGELAKNGGQRVYTSAVDVLRKTWKNEGLRGIQRGLPPGYVYQVCRYVPTDTYVGTIDTHRYFLMDPGLGSMSHYGGLSTQCLDSTLQTK
jgi:hypothetical protein